MKTKFNNVMVDLRYGRGQGVLPPILPVNVEWPKTAKEAQDYLLKNGYSVEKLTLLADKYKDNIKGWGIMLKQRAVWLKKKLHREKRKR